ncbi:MAG: SEC-C domain-containing protein, partial [Oscillospiraceae bacterium]|nr:SEC-C domain-containing protein [Oscillospiraceae bacterium]
GRAGRQGDPGESRFFLSLEDDLMRLFGGERIQNMMNMLKIEEDQPIENKVLTNSIESAQRKVEGRNFGIRKNVLQFDDVMNKQRELIYGQRNQVLNGENLKDYMLKMVKDMVENAVDTYLIDTEDHDAWNIDGLRDHLMGYITDENDLNFAGKDLGIVEKKDIVAELTEKAIAKYNEREEKFGAEVMRELERVVLLRNVDTKWMDHIDAMDELRQGIFLRHYGQHDPVVEYRLEGFNMFDEMVASIREDTVKMMLTVQIRREEEPQREQVANPTTESLGGGDRSVKKMPVKKQKIGDNDPCPCGSGKKYKKCCGMKAE